MRRLYTMWHKTAAPLLLACIAFSATSWADEAAEQAAVAKQLPSVKVSLQQGLTAAAAQGVPISGKFEVDEGAFQLSIYTMQGGSFFEVVVDHVTGKVAKSEPISEKEDFAEAKSQSAAMAKAKVTLKAAVDKAEQGLAGSRAVSVTSELKGGQPVAVVSLLKGGKSSSVSEPLE